MRWLDNYVKGADCDTVFEIKLEYLNSSSTKCLLNIISKAEQVTTRGKKCRINWYYTSVNSNIRECGEILRGIVGVEFNVIKSD